MSGIYHLFLPVRRLFFIAIFILSCFFPQSSWGGGAQQTTIDGVPFRWRGNLAFNADRGNLKEGVPAFGHDAVMQMVRDAFNTWGSLISSRSFSISEGESLPLPEDHAGGDINQNNYYLYLNSGAEVNPIVFDDNGEVMDQVFGECAKFSLLAFAGFEAWDPATGNVEKARAVFSGACIPDANGKTLSQSGCGGCTIRLDAHQVKTTILHEVGHLLGMDHSQVNPDSYERCRGGCSADVAEDIPTMFPIALPGAKTETLHADDIGYFRRLYDSDNQGCSVSGRVLAEDGSEMRGVEVVARNIKSGLSKTDAIAFVSGAEAPRYTRIGKDVENCKSGCGDFLISGLKSGETYQLCVQNIKSQFKGASGLEPVDPPVQSVEEGCFPDQEVTCQCSGNNCDVFPNQDLQTGSSFPSFNVSQGGEGSSAGGCSLVLPPKVSVWPKLKKLLEFVGRFK